MDCRPWLVLCAVVCYPSRSHLLLSSRHIHPLLSRFDVLRYPVNTWIYQLNASSSDHAYHRILRVRPIASNPLSSIYKTLPGPFHVYYRLFPFSAFADLHRYGLFPSPPIMLSLFPSVIHTQPMILDPHPPIYLAPHLPAP